ncbi:hypothetical protein FIV42_15295 [Persicimonas caeni]|uniref:AAA+ ATPase domain-containing protein n=1 Tax=Persicimonas caeni TaxID=2292766 RepID=A0A4Y6PVP0_PERCE|nr:ATP-binding protein [Persicimonas caeni]QDG52057.1 hypothetical protein FIV42_15295 [Persicimonas caeni]QED33278.1 AAA family ATPase [Persicimonas caeni]
MKITQLDHGRVTPIHICRVDNEPFPADLKPGVEVELIAGSRDKTAVLKLGDVLLAVEGERGNDGRELERLFVRNRPSVTWMLNRIDDHRIILQVHEFPYALERLEMDIAVDEESVDACRNIHSGLSSVEECVSWLTDQCLLGLQDDADDKASKVVSAFLSAGAEVDSDDLDAFTLHGRSVRVFVKREEHPDGDGQRLRVTGATRTAASSGTAGVALAQGRLAFKDHSVAARQGAKLRAQLEELTSARDSFLALWRKYGEMEGALKLEDARKFGVFRYHQWGFGQSESKIRFDLEDFERLPDAIEHVQGNVYIEAAKSAPSILTNEELEWGGFEHTHTTRPFQGEVDIYSSRLRAGHLVLELQDDDDLPPEKGFLYVSLTGDWKVYERRQEAQKTIRQMSGPISYLGLLLEGSAVNTPGKNTVESLSPAVQKRVFGEHPPTPNQREAIRAALNTPDIAVIHGPPGTGKTTVIRAIVQMLDEIHGDEPGEPVKILLSGFQHDAVENVVERIEVHGVPAVKFGGRNRRDGFAEHMGRVERTCGETIAALRERLPESTPSETRRHVDDITVNYLTAPRPPAATAQMLQRVIDSAGDHLTIELLDEIREQIAELRRLARPFTQDPERQSLVRAVRALRTTNTSFEDDGARNAESLLLRFERHDGPFTLGDGEQALLDVAATWRKGDDLEFLEYLEEMRHQLLLRVVPSEGSELRSTVREAVRGLLAKVRDELEERTLEDMSGIDAVAAEFCDTLEREPYAYRRTIEELTSVRGATCQQSASHYLARQKKGEPIKYDTVIIDEAARSTPLDLLIPMTQAERRIILVGDHRQLPHIVDRHIQDELKEMYDDEEAGPSVAERVEQFIEESLFERLRRTLMEAANSRYCVTLDEQYRMHPELGDFVSREFYEKTEDLEVRSGLENDDFEHELPGYEDAVAAWLDVPVGPFGREVDGQSKSRPAEAKIIAEELKRLIDAPQEKNLSFGVITYYGAQRDEIWQALCEHGLAEQVEPNEYRVAEDYLRLPDGRERLRVGTVDAFQGKEFDVVFLSMVRSNTKRAKTPHDYQSKYGFLMSPNRMCVSMSRQRKLLIVVGDRSFLREPGADEAIAPLIAFHDDLCRGEYGCIK